jgi:hypothetical protein
LFHPPSFFQEDDTVIEKTKWLAAWGVVLLVGTSEAQAQALLWEDRGYVAFNAGFQLQSRSFEEISTPVIYDENARIEVEHNVSGGALIDVAGGLRVWRNLAVGVGYSSFGDKETPTLLAQIPSPVSFDAPRQASASTGELSHNETAINVHLLWMIPISDKFELAAVVGPYFYKIEQDFVGTVDIVEGPPPFTTVTIRSVQPFVASKRATGFGAGLDGTYLFTPRIGAGAFVRFAGASADLETPAGNTVTVDAGGFQIGGGIRVRF